ncbi:hypothetical protein LTR50_005223 [Elasticomyces elasticus]|nr:hypothetical protein LTR50_005223 [Elasticomyces elasticus]
MATITATVTSFVTKTAASTSASATLRAAAQGGILEGSNPSHYDSKNPIIMFIIQAGIILVFCRLLHYPLSLLRQPRVIAEVIGGVLLGPSVMGRIPGFTAAIFPSAAMPNLSLIANLGLVLFLFLVGLEVDLRYLASNWRIALSVGTLGMALPFGLGCAISWGLYHEFRHEPGTVTIGFGVYMLFIGVAMAITAFPVLCRILTELKLLSTPVGIIVLSAGVGNDVVGWILLALCVALVNAGTGITALWVLLTCLGYILFLVFAVRPAFMWVLRRTRSLQDGPSQSIVALTLLIALISAFFTGVIGVHPIFGAFMAGLICPHEGGFAIKVTEKVEDLVSALFLPLYFALSGLSTNLGLLDTGITWAYVIGVVAIAFIAKFTGGALAARLNGLVWRESFTIGALMSCKGLVELIVLNIGLQAKILSTRTFTIFVVMALITTFATTPLTAALYPPWYQKKLEAWKRGEIDWDSGRPLTSGSDDAHDIMSTEKQESAKIQSLLVYVRLDNMPTLLAFVSLLGGKSHDAAPRAHPSAGVSAENDETMVSQRKRPVEVHGMRLLGLTERDSSVMKVSELDEYSLHDPVVNTFRTFGKLYNLSVSGEVAVLPEDSFAEALVTRAAEESSDLLLLPWSETGSMSESQTISADSVRHKLDSSAYVGFVATAFDTATCNTAVFIDNGFSGSTKLRPSALTRTYSGMSLRNVREHTASVPSTDRSHHIFMPYFGGADGQMALRLVLQMMENTDVTATIMHFEEPTGTSESSQSTPDHRRLASIASGKSRQTNTAEPTTGQGAAFFAMMQKSTPSEYSSRILFETTQSATPCDAALKRAQEEVGQNPRNAGDLIVVGRHYSETSSNAGSVISLCLGAMASVLVNSGIRASVLVVQAKTKLN